MVFQQSLPVRNNSSSLRRALRVLDGVAQYRGRASGISLSSLAASLDMSKSTVLRLIGPLRDEGLVHQDRDSGRYRLGPATARLGAAFVERADLDVLAADLIRDLARRSGGPAVLLLRNAMDDRRSAGATIIFSAAEPDGHGGRMDDGRVRGTLRDRGWWAEIDEDAVSTVAAPVRDHLSHVVAAVECPLPSSVAMGARRSELSTVGTLIRDCAATLSVRLGAPLITLDPTPPQAAHLTDGTMS